MDIKTRAGVVPAQNDIPFEITTKDAETFLQKKVDGLINLMNQKGRNHDDVKVMLLSAKCSKKFIPFMLLLPTSVIKGSKNNRNEYEPSIFTPEDDDRSVKLEDEIYKLVKCYCFTPNEVESFFSATWRQALNISLKTAHSLKATSKPTVQKFNDGKSKFVVCFIDPVRVFKDMLTDVRRPDERFGIEIGEKYHIQNGNYKYKVYRGTNKKNKETDSLADRLAFEVNKRITT